MVDFNKLSKKKLDKEDKKLEFRFLQELQKFGLGKGATLTEHNEYCSWDAESDEAIIEFKYRDGEYAEYIIEMNKLSTNLHYARKTGFKFYYVVMTYERIIIWDLDAYTLENNFNCFCQELPTNQHRGENKKINKLITLLPTKKAVKIIKRWD